MTDLLIEDQLSCTTQSTVLATQFVSGITEMSVCLSAHGHFTCGHHLTSADVQLSTEMRRGQDLLGKHGILLTPDNWSILAEPHL